MKITIKILVFCMLFLVVLTNVSAIVTIDIEMEDRFEEGDEVFFTFKILSDMTETVTYVPSINCGEEVPVLPGYLNTLNLVAGIQSDNFKFTYMEEVGEDIEPVICEAVVVIVDEAENLVSERVTFLIATKPSFLFNILLCGDELCDGNTLAFIRKENLYIDYSFLYPPLFSVNLEDFENLEDPFLEIDEPEISAILTSPDGGTQNIILPFSFKPNKNGVYSLDVVASAKGYKTFTQTYEFAVIEENAEIDDAEVIPYEELEDYDPENFYWTNAYNENISVAQVETIVRMVAAEPNGAYFEIFEYDSILGENDEIRTGYSKIRGLTFDDKLVGKWIITGTDYDLSPDHEDYYFINDGKRSRRLEILSKNYEANFCEDYIDKDYCESCSDYSCSVARNSVEPMLSDLKFGEAKCGGAYGDEGYVMDCFCKWDIENKKCDSGFRAIPPSVDDERIGECVFFGDSEDNCDDGFLEVSWKSNWEWHNEGMSDPLELRSDCKDGAKAIPCPAQAKLPFFGLYNFIGSLILVGLIYSFLIFVKVRNSSI